jgi:TIR domain-containing protein
MLHTLTSWDVFISHAYEDKATIARPLAQALSVIGLSVWFDEFTLTAGDSLSSSINYGLENSKYGIVIVSERFLEKKWPQRELAGLFAKEDQAKVIIPVWHEITEEAVRSHSPVLADRVALRSSVSIDKLVKELLRAMNLPFGRSELTGMWFGKTGRLRLFKIEDLIEGDYDWNGRDWAAHLRGRIANDVFVFDWWWDFTPERGGGYFFFREATLEGEWWLGQEVNGEPIPRNKYDRKRNEWRYQRVKQEELAHDEGA